MKIIKNLFDYLRKTLRNNLKSIFKLGNILIIGAGRSSTILIKYLLSISERYNYFITIADSSEILVHNSMKDFPDLRSILFDINNNDQRCQEIKDADIVISMLPAYMHIIVAKDCLRFKKNLSFLSKLEKKIKLN